MPMAYSPTFTVLVITGYLLTVVGAVLALAAAVWWMRAGEWAHEGPPPPAFRALTTAAFTMFTVGLFWQLIGYLRLDYAAGW